MLNEEMASLVKENHISTVVDALEIFRECKNILLFDFEIMKN